MQIDLLFDPFGATWHEIQEGGIAAEGEGCDGGWLYDTGALTATGPGIKVTNAYCTLFAPNVR